MLSLLSGPHNKFESCPQPDEVKVAQNCMYRMEWKFQVFLMYNCSLFLNENNDVNFRDLKKENFHYHT